MRARFWARWRQAVKGLPARAVLLFGCCEGVLMKRFVISVVLLFALTVAALAVGLFIFE